MRSRGGLIENVVVVTVYIVLQPSLQVLFLFTFCVNSTFDPLQDSSLHTHCPLQMKIDTTMMKRKTRKKKNRLIGKLKQNKIGSVNGEVH